ncbi:MAG: hypothetical protein NVSMB48_05570 [Marmoricola sp.]
MGATAQLPTAEEWERRSHQFQAFVPSFVTRSSPIPDALRGAVPEFGRIQAERAALIERERAIIAANDAARVRRHEQIEERQARRDDARLRGTRCDLPPLVPEVVTVDGSRHTLYREPEEGLEQLPYPEASSSEWDWRHGLLQAEELFLLKRDAAELREWASFHAGPLEEGVVRARSQLAAAEAALRPFAVAAEYLGNLETASVADVREGKWMRLDDDQRNRLGRARREPALQ